MKAWIAFAVPAFLLGTLIAQAPETGNLSGPREANDPPIVRNAPYSAEMITTFDRLLPSGKYIHGETHGKAFRDSQGRTRKDADAVGSSGMDPKAVFVLIIDPVARCNITLDSRTRTAEVYPWLASVKRSSAPGSPRPDAAAVPGGSAVASPTTPGGSPATGGIPSDGIASAGVTANALTTEDLGTREMEGLTVSGLKLTHPAKASPGGDGQAGTVVIMRWESKDLQILVDNETDDPQRGHTATRLVHIVRTEPDAALFQIPSGYTVTDHRPKSN